MLTLKSLEGTDMSNPSRQKALEKAQMKVLFQVPFFAPGVAKLPVVWDDTVETACTNGEVIRWNTAFFDRLSEQERVTLLCHEVAHPLLGHLWRLPPPGGDHGLANEAADYKINQMLQEFGDAVKAKRLADPFPFPDWCPGLRDKQYDNLSEEEIYQRLASRTRSKGPGGVGTGGNPGKGQGGAGNGQNNPSPSQFGQFQAPCQGGSGQQAGQKGKQGGGQPDPAASQKLKNDWAATLIQSATIAAGRGDCPLGIQRLVDALVKPKVDWQEVLKSWLREKCADDWDFMKPAMEFDGSGFLMPSMESDRIGWCLFAKDTSGSINQELLAKFLVNTQWCLDEMRPSKLVDICCDSKIHQVKEYTPGDTIDRNAPGGGGTSFVPVWDYIRKMPSLPKCVVYLTDLDGDFGEDPGVPVIWVTWTEGGKAPFGDVIYVGD